MAPPRPRGPTQRLLALPATRRLVLACAVLGGPVGGSILAQWTLVAAFVAAVFLAGRRTRRRGAPTLRSALAWLARSGLLALRDLLAARTSSRVRRDARSDLARKLLRLGPDPMTGERAGELVTTATGGIAKLDGVVARLVPGTVTAAVLTPLLAVTVFVLDPPSGALLLLGGTLIMLFLWLVGTLAGASSRAQWETLGQLGALLVDILRVLPTLVAYNRAKGAMGWVGQVSEAYRAATMKVLRTAFLSGFVLEFGATLCTALVAVTVGIRLFQGHLEFELALLVLLLTPEFFAPLRALGADHHAALEGRPAAERLFTLLDLPEPARGTTAVSSGVPHVRLRGVTLRREGRTVLDGVDLDLPPLSRTALVGPSGAGKSSRPGSCSASPRRTRARYSSTACRCRARPRRVAGAHRLRPRAAVPAGRHRAGERAAGPPRRHARGGRTALDRAHALEFVRRLPQGLDTPLGEDAARLSGGERLRIALARAFVKDAPVVVLDEPTSQLDPGGEAQVLAALRELADGRTMLTITHRSAPLALHDRIVEIDEGAVREHETIP